MKVGQEVHLYDRTSGRKTVATVVNIDGAGPSFNKILTLKPGKGDAVQGVAHAADVNGRHRRFWTLLDETPPKGWKKETAEEAQ